MLYKVFIDDSGSREYSTPYSRDFTINAPETEKYLDFWRKNYFVLTAVRVSESSLDVINQEINDLKFKTFQTNDVEIKSDWLRNPFQRKKHYLELFNITQESLNQFGEAIFDLIGRYRSKLKLISVVFDKRFFGDKRRQEIDADPLAKTAQVLFERLQYLGNYNVVIFDQMDSSLQVTRGDNGLVFKVYNESDCMKQIYVKSFTAISDVRPADSSKENFLQIADICGYPVYRQFVHYGRQWLDPNSKMQLYPYFGKIRCNFIPKRGKVCGISLICIPDFQKNNWDLLKGCDEIKKTSP